MIQISSAKNVAAELERQKVSEDPRESQIPYPSNLVVESHDQHSRWFLTSLVTSVALTGHAPFKNLKTLGMFLDDSGEPMSYQSSMLKVDPTDLIEGTIKQHG